MKFIFGAFFISTAILGSNFTLAAEGGNTSGGGNPFQVEAGALKVLIEGVGLKNAMVNYLRTLQVERIEETNLRKLFQSKIEKNRLVEDIQTSRYKVGSCTDSLNQAVYASANLGQRSGDICFDSDRLAEALMGLNEEQVMVHLAALAFHEHTHHFQIFSKLTRDINENEAEANKVAGYVLLTAKFVQLPLLKWTEPTNQSGDLQSILDLVALAKAKEEIFLLPAKKDFANNSDFQGKTDRGLVRILPREKYDGKILTRGGGAYYGFEKQDHSNGYASDIGLQMEHFSVGFAGCDYGFFTDLGKVNIRNVTADDKALSHILNYQPPHDDEEKVRIEQRRYLWTDREMKNERGPIVMDGFEYFASFRPVVGHTYGLRSINFGESDVAVLIQVLRKDRDGSFIILWKKLKSYEPHSCR